MFFDVDGVITKGPNVIPAARRATQQLNHLEIPYVFVSNTCMLESEKADQLTDLLSTPVSCQQIVDFISSFNPSFRFFLNKLFWLIHPCVVSLNFIRNMC